VEKLARRTTLPSERYLQDHLDLADRNRRPQSLGYSSIDGDDML
jgi:hypothetical protein